MLFNSFHFLFVFLPVVLIVYWLAARRARPVFAIAWLAIASYAFYLFGETLYPWLLAGSILVNFAIGHLMARREGPRRKALLIAGVIFNLVLLGIFKYSDFLVGQLAALDLPYPAGWHVALPVGISFFTFTQIAYLADVAARKTESPDIVRYGLFVTYFPHLIAGPIIHNKEMLPQFEQPDTRDIGLRLYGGLAMLAIGLAKKVLLADPCGSVATGIFDHANDAPGFLIAWIGAVTYTLQIYFDFSGYSDMAIGMSQMLGIKLPINFNSPYKSASIIDFWRRWHITLSRFLRDYLYIPLGGNRRGEPRRFVNLFATMLLGGLWHGAGWTFILWGTLHGAAQTMAHGWRAIGKQVRLPRVPLALGWLLTTLFVIVAWVPFRAPSLHITLQMWKGMLGLAGAGVPDISLFGPLRRWVATVHPVDFGSTDMVQPAIALVIALLLPNSQQIMGRFGIGLDSPGYDAHGAPTRLRLGIGLGSCLLIGLLLGVAMRAIGGYSEFIYFHF